MSCVPNIYVFITVQNNGEKALHTLDSVFASDYKGFVCVTVVDFSSTDDSYEKLLDAREKYKFSLYQAKKYIHSKSRLAYAQRINGFFGSRGVSLFLRPGELLLPNAFVSIANAYKKYSSKGCSAFLFPSDSVKNKIRVPHHICSGIEFLKYVLDKNNHGIYTHELLAVSLSGYDTCRWLGVGLNNESVFISDISYLNSCIYVPTVIKKSIEFYAEDEFNEVMTRFAMIVSNFRAFQISRFTELREKFLEQLSFHSLWRSFVAYTKRNTDDAKKCFELSTVIYPGIEQKKIHSLLNSLYYDSNVQNGGQDLVKSINDYFSKERTD